MTTQEKISEKIIWLGKWMLFLAVASLFLRRNDLYWPFRRLFEIFICGSLSLTILWLLITGKWEIVTSFIQKIKWPFGLIIAGLLIASLSSYVLFNVSLDKEGVLNLGRIFLVMIMVFLVIFHARQDSNFAKKIPFAFFINLLFVPALWINPGLLDQLGIVAGRFQGFENFPSNASYLFLIVLTITFNYLLKIKNKFYNILFFTLSVFSMSFIWWTHSRASWLGAIVIFTILIFKNFRYSLKKIFVGVCIAVIILFAGHLFLPSVSQITTSIKIWFPNTNAFDKTKYFQYQNINPIEDQLPRLFAWSYYFKALIKNPLGLGVSYFYKDLAVNFNGKPIGPHNTILEILVMSGLIGFIGFVWLWYLVLKKAANKPFLLAAFCGLWIASLFDNMIALKSWWVVIGLMLV